MTIDHDGRIFTGGYSGVWASTNGGDSWPRQFTGTLDDDTRHDPVEHILAGSYSGGDPSIDRYRRHVGANRPGGHRRGLDHHESGRRDLRRSPTAASINRRTTASWTHVGIPGANRRHRSHGIDLFGRSSGGSLGGGSAGGVFRSGDGGATGPRLDCRTRTFLPHHSGAVRTGDLRRQRFRGIPERRQRRRLAGTVVASPGSIHVVQSYWHDRDLSQEPPRTELSIG
jgi:hypothetical protein